ncbi:MAG: cysteine hydrolase family protein [Solirubrobacteraceae bacterium]
MSPGPVSPDAPERSALVVVDMLKTYDHEDGGPLRDHVAAAIPALVRLLVRAREEDVPVAYANDVQGEWAVDRRTMLGRLRRSRDAGLVEPILPADDVPILAKARHSAFVDTLLPAWLADERITRLVLAGQVTEQCVLYTAIDAYERGFDVAVPDDAVAGIDDEMSRVALRMIAENLGGDVAPGAASRLAGPPRAIAQPP